MALQKRNELNSILNAGEYNIVGNSHKHYGNLLGKTIDNLRSDFILKFEGK